MKKDNTSQTITLVEQKVTKKAKNTLYLVLKKKKGLLKKLLIA